jgi:hypothetical protein
MVSKLLLAVEENILSCNKKDIALKLLERYRDIRAGLGFNKTPSAYGAFPTDPYSHTPKGQGARQPGMTGLVKEEIITRFGELALTFEDGCLVFNPILLNKNELISSSATFDYIDVAGRSKTIALPANALAYTCCQTPIILQVGKEAEIQVDTRDGGRIAIPGNRLDELTSRHIFKRDGWVEKLLVQLKINWNER